MGNGTLALCPKLPRPPSTLPLRRQRATADQIPATAASGLISRPPAGAHVQSRRSPENRGRRVTSVAPGEQLGSGRLRRFACAGCASFLYASLRTAGAAASKTARNRYRVRLGGRGRQIWQTAHPPVAERIFAVRRETGKEQVVRVHYDEGLANRIGPKPCAGTREGASEASVGERIGQPLSHENSILGADAVAKAEGNTDRRAIASAARPGGVREPGMCGHSLRGNREISCLTRGGMPPLARTGKARSRSR